MAEISFTCKRTVVSTKPVQPGKFCRLSVLDRIMESNHLRIVFYYQSPVKRQFGEMTKKLRESISETLNAFPIVTGRLLRAPEGHWMIKCNDAGVRMVEARAKGTVEEWLHNVDREKELKLVYWEEIFCKPYFWSTFYVQLTEFEEGGLAIGLSCIHLLADPICATNFIKAWADTTLSGVTTSPPYFHSLPQRNPVNVNNNHKLYADLIDHYKSSIGKPAPATSIKHTTITLAFTNEMVQSCMGMATTQGAPDNSSPTPFEALAGLFWVCISKAKGIRSGLTSMCICLDMRKVLHLDQAFFGNCVVYNKVQGEGLEENDHQLSKAAIAIREVEDKMNDEGIMDLIEWLECNDYQSPPWMNGQDLVCANLEKLDSYSAIFENNAKPIRASYYIEPALGEGHVLILPSTAVGDGPFSRVVMVTLPENQAIKLCEDVLVQSFSPTILMEVNKYHS